MGDLTYVYYSRVLDVWDAMEEGTTDDMDNADFAGTGIPEPYEHGLPSQTHVSGEEEEEVRERVLSWAVVGKIDADAGIARIKEAMGALSNAGVFDTPASLKASRIAWRHLS